MRKFLSVETQALIFVAGFLGLAAWSAAAADRATAKQVLNTAGVSRGLCVCLGCGSEASPGLVAALAADSKLLVHGLAIDEAALARARKAVEAQNLLGQVTIEKMASLAALPHVRDLANLVVIEDFNSLAARGLTMEEVRRITAPGGAICIAKDGRWTKTPKARPKEMDDWTHPAHGPDSNRVSSDRMVEFPMGLRWQDGVPMNFNLWAACRGWVIAGGRCFTLSTTEAENLGPTGWSKHKQDEYVTARDAFNGMTLWKVNCETSNDGKYLNAWNVAPIVTDGKRVYVYKKDALVGLDAATGDVRQSYPVKYPSVRLLLSDGILVSAGWEGKEEGKDPGPQSLWAPWVSKNHKGSVEAYDAATGAEKWSMPIPAQETLAADGAVYLLMQSGNPTKEQRVVAVDLQTGRQRWSVPHTIHGADPGLHLLCGGQKVLVVARVRGKSIAVLSAADGKTLWEIKSTDNFWTPMVDGLLWHGDKKYDPKTGEVKGKLPAGISSPVCTPSAVVNNIVTASRGCQYIEFPAAGDDQPKPARWISFGGARGGCIEGAVPALGMFFTSQNNCRCAPGQVQGFVAFGPCGDLPVKADFEQSRPIETGPGLAHGVATNAAPRDEWPMYRHDPARSGATATRLADTLEAAWESAACTPPDGPMADAWKTRFASCMTAPVVAGGRVFAAATEQGQVAALDAASGKPLWRYTTGGRIDTAPTIYQGLCVFGSHDGWVYALRASDGQLAWRTRLAPKERRMVSFGQVESVWPVVGSVLMHDGLLYASAGRTTESDGGIALCALEPKSGRQVWATGVAPGPQRVNDMLAMEGNKLALHHIRIDPKDGKNEIAKDVKSEAFDGTIDGTWTRLGNRRSGNLTMGRLRAEMVVSSAAMVYGYEGHWRGVVAVRREKTAPTPGVAADKDALRQEDFSWRVGLPPDHQAEAMALAENGLVLAGRVVDAKTGTSAGFLWIINPTDGKKLGEQSLAAPPCFQGIALAGGKIYLTLENGQVVCLGK